MDYHIIGKKIKELRNIAGLTQGELAEGICTQAMISHIEKGDTDPSATVLYQISKKLGVDVNYFFEIGSTPRLDYIREVERQLRKLRVKLLYEDILDIVKAEEKNPLFMKDPYNRQLLLWHRGIYVQEVVKDREKAYAMMEEALMLTYTAKKTMTEREMTISISMGIIKFSSERYEEAMKIYERVRKAIGMTSRLQDKAINARLLYNMARVLTRLGQFERSITYCEEGLSWNVEEENLYGFAQLNYQIGYNLELQGFYQESIPHYDRAAMLFDMHDSQKLVSFITSKKAELIEKMED
ncbi:helix-turn-helix transcriptional regulator [Rossellomorea aquimaris]|uniref:helix-turn-helix domain-containing protein n=1 Tax=Rossellomorea aquimaris TaxID=189382 RepID=UPI001CD4246E|nr:helix-turn-helix domain-containing protein [Rossellomorea aquimaris]MCA1055280.1 helix-turn-helix transcriptional regulator [Rossellomorea aquimaris]